MNDCFTHGWEMQEVAGDYQLYNKCIENNCREKGWKSIDTNGDSFSVTCKGDGCFTEGWSSVHHVDGKVLKDEVTCKGSNCLVYGWTVKTGYDLSGGNVTCGNFDCARFGGVSFWRGRASKTACQDSDCYGKGWWLWIY